MNSIMKPLHILTSGIIALTVCLAPSCKHQVRKESERLPVKVKVQEIVPRSLSSEKTYVGKIESHTEVLIKSPFPAKLKDLKTAQGKKVASGDVVAEIFSENVENTLASAKATMRQAQDGYDRIQAVKDNGSVPEIKIIEVETQLAKARALLSSAQKAKDDCLISTPFSGTVSDVMVKEGEDLTLLQPIMKIIDLGHLEVRIDVPESEVSGFKIGDRAKVSIPAISNQTFDATLTEKGISASDISHSYRFTLGIANAPKEAMPGMIGKVSFVKEDNTAPVIPASVIRSDIDGKYVWTVNERGLVEKTRITTGGFSNKGIIVTEGLSRGDRLIVEGMSKVSTGMKVNID